MPYIPGRLWGTATVNLAQQHPLVALVLSIPPMSPGPPPARGRFPLASMTFAFPRSR